MMKKILSILVLFPILVLANPKTDNNHKTDSYNIPTAVQYPNFYEYVFANSLITNSVYNPNYGSISIYNNTFSCNFALTWGSNIYYKTGVVFNINISPALPDMELGPILYSNGFNTGYTMRISNNQLIIDPPPYFDQYYYYYYPPYFTQLYLNFQINLDCVNNWYPDLDKDGYGYKHPNGPRPITSCGCPVASYVSNNLDCDDYNAEITSIRWQMDSNKDGIITELDYPSYMYIYSCTEPSSNSYGDFIKVKDIDNHWIHEVSFDILGNVTGASRSYYDNLGKTGISLSKDFVTNKIWGTETTYDDYGRPDKTTFAAPSDYTKFTKQNFVNSSSLMYYYSDYNSLEPYQATATQPYSQTNYDSLNPGNVINVVGGNKINGEWKTGYSYTVPAAQEMYYVYGTDYYDGTITSGKEEVITKFFKTVSVDANGVENVAFTDGEGKVLATARSGGATSYPVVSLIGTQGYVDVHIPAGINSSHIAFIGSPSSYKVYNLKTGLLVTGPLTGGNGYRIEAVTPPTTDPKSYISLDYNQPIYDAGVLGINYPVNYYDYAVNIYNKTGQLIKSVQPKGCNLGDIIPIKNVTPIVGSSDFATIYSYNDQGHLKEVVSPDEGISKFLYRQDGQIRYSQSALQEGTKVSYTNYDSYARPIESGVITGTTGIWATATANVDAVALIVGTPAEQTFTVYDDATNNQTSVALPASLTLSSVLTAEGFSTANYTQNNLSGNVAVTYKADSGTITAISWYSYDIYGRTEWIVQYNEGLGTKTIHYNYDYKGNVSSVVFQKDKTTEQFTHKYTYNANSVLTKVETATYGTPFVTHADYTYYLTGELKRVNIAEGLQGLDYVYTLGGQLKSINHPSLESSKDPGGDTNDVFGITLDYYSGDYLRTGRNITASPSITTPDYNGNIKAVRWKNKSIDINGNSDQKAYLYNYNRDNWLTSATFGAADASTAAINETNFYKEGGLTYDANGNIKTLQRTNGSGNVQDNLTYTYNTNKNQLNSVSDTAGNNAAINDIDTQSADNYVYDAIGQLIQNTSENLYYFYNTQGLVTEVRLGASTPVVKFFYNERGQRIRKDSYSSGNLQNTTYYALDLSGNTMAVYNKPVGSGKLQTDLPIYGLSRLGVYTRANATSSYEITDHLGNVRAVIQKVNGSPQIQSYADYYPFGELLPGRNSLNYRYAFQGQELDTETGMEAFQLRLWDGRLGRWLSPDPYGEFHSPYLGMGNNPINLIDPDGGRTNDPPTDGIPHYLDNTGEYFWNSVVNSYDKYDLPNNSASDFSTTFSFGAVIGNVLNTNIKKYDFLIGSSSPLNEINFSNNINPAQFNFYEKGYKESLSQIKTIKNVTKILSKSAYALGYIEAGVEISKGNYKAAGVSGASNYVGEEIGLAYGWGAGLAWIGTWTFMDKYVSKTELYNKVLFGVHSSTYKEREKYWWKSKMLNN